MLKVLALGALGYFAYRHLGQKKTGAADIRIAGGPLSNRAVLVHSLDELPPTEA